MTNIERVAEHIARCRNPEKVEAALSALLILLKPSVENADPVGQEHGISIADVLASADISTLNK